MAKHRALIFVLLMALSIREAIAADESLQILEDREAYYSGVSLGIDLVPSCPTNTYSCGYWNVTDAQPVGPCCPTQTFCDVAGFFCCPTSDDCSDTVSAAPTCADPSWTLFDGESDLTCCPTGMLVGAGGVCVATTGTGKSAPDTAWSSTTQANDAAPTGDATASDEPSSESSTLPTTASSNTQGTGTTSATGDTSPTKSAATASATKKSSADKTFAAGGSLACVMAVMQLIL